MTNPSSARVAVVGGGYAGCAAAVELAARGIAVDLLEAGRVLGGRARRLESHGTVLDNGQHLLSGAYKETLRLLALVGVDAAAALLRMPLELAYPGRLRLAAPRLPAPLHMAWALARARGPSGTEKLEAAQFMNCLKATRFELHRDLSVAELLDDHGQAGLLRELVWEPLCLAALNTPAEYASARVFLAVLRDTLGGRRAASDLLLPRRDLSALFPEAAAEYLRGHGGRVECGRRIAAVVPVEGGYGLQGAAGGADGGVYSHVVVAVAPQHLCGLLAGLPQLAPQCQQIGRLAYEPIVTCYLQYEPEVALQRPMLGLSGGLGQWLFDRGRCGGPPGLLAAVISARGPHQEQAHAALAAAINGEVSALLGRPLQPLWSQVVEEKRATFACTPDLPRPGSETALPGLFLAGDYVASEYPATLETAVRSGVACARSIAAQIAQSQPL